MIERIDPQPPSRELAPAGRQQAIDITPARRYESGPPPGYGYPPEFDERDEGGLLEYWRLLKRRKGTVVLLSFLGMLAGVLLTLPQTPIYQARSTLEIQDINENFMNIRNVTETTDAPFSALYDIQTQVRILQSRTLIEKAMEALKIKKPEQFSRDPGRVSAWRRALNLPEPPPAEAWDQALEEAAGSTKVRASGQTRILEILVDSTDPRVASDFANTMTNEFIEQNIEARWKSSQRVGEWLSKQLEEMRIKLEKSEDSLQAYARNSGLLFTAERTNVAEEKLRQLQQALSGAQADRIAKQSRWEMANSSPPETLPDVLNDASLRAYQTRLTELRQKLAELTSTYTASHPQVKRIEPQVTTVEAAFDRERSAILKRIRNEYDEALRKEKLLDLDYTTQAKLVTAQGEKAIHYNILKREVDSNRQLYEAMLQRVKEASIASAMRASNVRVVDAAKPPKSPYKPNLSMNGLMGLLLGGFGAVAYVIMAERANRALKEPGEAALYLNLPELGVIPSRGLDAGEKRSIRLRAMQASKPAVLTDEQGRPERVELATWQQKPSMLAESFRATLTSILFSGQNGSRPRMLVVTSAGPAEGKSTVATNLAIALAEIGQRVLLIDADMRKPQIHEIFGMENQQGLTTLLQRAGSSASAGFDGLIRESDVPNLFVLTSGPTVLGVTNLLYTPRTAEMLECFRKEFDMVLFDTPPMLHIPDARVLGKMSDAVLLVVRAGQTTRDAALAAKQRLMEDGIPVLGTVLNDWNPKSSPGGYYGYYGGYYGKYYRKGYY